MTEPAILTVRALADRLGLSRTTVHAWLTTDAKWRACIVHQTRRKYWLSVQRLTDAGILPRAARESPLSAGPIPGFSINYCTQGIA